MALVIADRVKETSTSTGLGDITLAGATTGFVTFASKCSVGDTLYYCIQGVDAFGIPSGEWECGLGTYSASNTLTRTSFTSSSTGSAVSFSAGTKQVYLTIPAVQVAWARERLKADRTYYVRTDGADTNTGLANTAGGAFLTIQKAIDVVSDTLDLGGFTATVQIADGTYTAGVVMSKQVVGGFLVVQGNSGAYSNVIVSTTNADCFLIKNGSVVTVKYMELRTTTSGAGIAAWWSSVVSHQSVVFGTCAGHHILSTKGSTVTALGSYTINGGSTSHVAASYGGAVSFNSIVVTLSGALSITNFVNVNALASVQCTGTTYAGSTATGNKYVVVLNGVINTGAAVAFPCASAGSSATGGVFA